MAVLQILKKTPSIRKVLDLEEALIKCIEWILGDYSEGRVVFDRYLDQFLKNKTSQKRATKCTEITIHPEMKLTMSLKNIQSSSRTKSSLTIIFAQSLLRHYSTESLFKLVVVYDTTIKEHNFEENHSQEETATLIFHQVLAALAQ